MGVPGDGDGGRAARAFVRGVALKPVTVGTGLAVLATVHAVVNARLLRTPALDVTPTRRRVSVLIPARDEAAAIGACLATIDGGHEVLVLDDGSVDGTAGIAAAHGARVITGTTLPPGWLGKPHACTQLASAAHGDVLVFLDADVRLEPGAIDEAAALLDEFDIVAPHPRQLADTIAERLVQPLLQWSVLSFLPLRLAERSPRPSLCAANGQFLVVRRAAYLRAGGHVPDAVFDDLALVRAIKRTGGHAAFVDGSSLASCRMYAGWPELRDGYSKSLWSAFGSPLGSAAVIGATWLAYVLPPLAALRGSRAGAIGYLAAVLGRVVTARRTGGRIADAPAHPLSIVLFGYLTVRSHELHRRGRLRWKGRPVS